MDDDDNDDNTKVTKNRLHELLIIKITIRGRTITVIIVIIISKGELHGIQKGPKSCWLFCVAKEFQEKLKFTFTE